MCLLAQDRVSQLFQKNIILRVVLLVLRIWPKNLLESHSRYFQNGKQNFLNLLRYSVRVMIEILSESHPRFSQNWFRHSFKTSPEIWDLRISEDLIQSFSQCIMWCYLKISTHILLEWNPTYSLRISSLDFHNRFSQSFKLDSLKISSEILPNPDRRFISSPIRDLCQG